MMTSSIKELWLRPSGRTVDARSYKGVGRATHPSDEGVEISNGTRRQELIMVSRPT